MKRAPPIAPRSDLAAKSTGDLAAWVSEDPARLVEARAELERRGPEVAPPRRAIGDCGGCPTCREIVAGLMASLLASLPIEARREVLAEVERRTLDGGR